MKISQSHWRAFASSQTTQSEHWGCNRNYHIVVLRLSSVAAIPDTSPDIRYPNISSISCREGSTPSTDGVGTTYQPYITAEANASNFLVIGGGNSKADPSPGEQVQCNDRLVPGGVYTVFIRAYPSPICVPSLSLALFERGGKGLGKCLVTSKQHTG